MCEKILVGKDAYYKAAIEVLDCSKCLRIAAKTPSLLMKEEKKGKWRSLYVKKVEEKIFSGKVNVKYLVSYNEMKNSDDAKKNIEKFSKLKNFSIRFSDGFSSIFIGDELTAIPLKSMDKSSAVIVIKTNKEIIKWFDGLFEKLSKTITL